MAFWWYAVLAVIVLLIAAAVSRIRVRMRYSRSGENDDLVLVVHALYGAYRYRAVVQAVLLRGGRIFYRKMSTQEIAGKSKFSRPRWRVGGGTSRRVFGISGFRSTLKKLECTRFRLDLRVGTGDAPSTAVLSGVLWTLYGCVIALASRTVTLKTKPHGGVEPVYGSEEFSIVWEADIRIRVGVLAWSLFKAVKQRGRLRQSWKNWRKAFKGPQSA